MYASREMLIKATELTTDELQQACASSSTMQDAIISATFKGFTTGGTFVYDITYEDEYADEDGIGQGKLFVKIVRAPLSNKMVFVADF